MCKQGYRGIADDFRAAIRSGDYPPGSVLPNQGEIARNYGVNINTVRRAINVLRIEQLVIPIPGHGTKVQDPNPVRLPLTRYTQVTPGAGPFEAACEAQGLRGVTDVTDVSRRHADAIIALVLDIPEGSEVVARSNQMRIVAPASRARIVQLQTTWLPKWVAEGTPLAMPDKIVGGIYRGLEDTGQILGRAEEVVSVRMPTRDEALALDLRLGSPVMDIRRTTTNQHGKPVVHTHLVVTDHVCLVYPQEL